LSLIDSEFPREICVEDKLKKENHYLDATIQLAKRNGLYYYFILRLRELNLVMSFVDKDYWNREIQKLSALKKTLAFLNEVSRENGIDYILIKACTSIPHVPRDIDIFVRTEDRTRIRNIFESNGMRSIYSNDVETVFIKDGYIKVDIYSRIQYLSKEFIDNKFLWHSSIEDQMLGINFRHLNKEADFLCMLIHSIFGHRSMTLLDFMYMRSILNDIQDIDFCREYARNMGWSGVFDLGLEKLMSLYNKIYEDREVVCFPYLFDWNFILKCISKVEKSDMKRVEKVFFLLSLGLDRVNYELKRSPFYDSLSTFNTGKRMFNNLNYFVRSRCGDKKDVYLR
jgi:hypothetical protein